LKAEYSALNAEYKSLWDDMELLTKSRIFKESSDQDKEKDAQ